MIFALLQKWAEIAPSYHYVCWNCVACAEIVQTSQSSLKFYIGFYVTYEASTILSWLVVSTHLKNIPNRGANKKSLNPPPSIKKSPIKLLFPSSYEPLSSWLQRHHFPESCPCFNSSARFVKNIKLNVEPHEPRKKKKLLFFPLY